MTFPLSLCSVSLILLFGALASGQNTSDEISTAPWDVSVFAAIATGEENSDSLSEAQLFTAGLFVGRTLTGPRGWKWFRGRFEYGADLVPLFVQLRPQTTYGIAFDPIVLRWNSSIRWHRASPYLELGGGGFYTGTNFPVGDTSTFNFIARGGSGVYIFTKPTQAVDLGCRWWHISNANLGVRNPEFNGVQITLGWHWLK